MANRIISFGTSQNLIDSSTSKPIISLSSLEVYNDVDMQSKYLQKYQLDDVPYDAEVEYIESTGTQWIDTEIIPTVNTKAQFKVYNINSTNVTIFGCNQFDANDWRFFNADEKMYFDIKDERLTANEIDLDIDEWREFEIGNYYVKDLSTNTILMEKEIVQEFDISESITLNGRRYPSKNRWGYVKIYENDELVQYLIPVRKGKIGYMYDKISKKLFENKGIGNFICGKDVESIDPYEWKVQKSTNVKAIFNSLRNIFTWNHGERILLPEFGSKLHTLLYEGITPMTEEAIIAEIRSCVSEWEPRIQIVDIINASNIDDTEDNTIYIQVVFTIPSLGFEQYTYGFSYASGV